MKHTFKQMILFLVLAGMIVTPLSAMNFIDYKTQLGCLAVIVSIGVAVTGVVFYKKYCDFQKNLDPNFRRLGQK